MSFMSELITLQNEVKVINDKIITLSKDNLDIEWPYKGCQIYFSHFFQKSKFNDHRYKSRRWVL